jgi:uncharacterized protein (TIGR03083 family)
MNPPVQTRHLFTVLDHKLSELLHSLKPEDWNRNTRAKLWTVKDVATHLLDGNIRAISMLRDNYFGDPAKGITSYQHLVDYLNQLNAAWVKATKRMSPALLIELLELTGKEFTRQMHSLDLFAPAQFSVAWAGEERSLNWFHIAREYTEKWHHQQQIREAVHGDADKELISRELYAPVLETFMLALPHAYRAQSAEAGTLVHVTISGSAGGDWYLFRKHDQWELTRSRSPDDIAASAIIINQQIAWKLFTRGMSHDEALISVAIKGNKELSKALLSMVCVMA